MYVHFGTAYNFSIEKMFIHEFSCACSRPFAIHMNRKCTLLFSWKEKRSLRDVSHADSITFATLGGKAKRMSTQNLTGSNCKQEMKKNEPKKKKKERCEWTNICADGVAPCC